MGTFGIFIAFGVVSTVLGKLRPKPVSMNMHVPFRNNRIYSKSLIHFPGDIAFKFVCEDHETNLARCRHRSAELRHKGFDVTFLTDFQDWTFFTLFENLGDSPAWMMICTENTVVDLWELAKLVNNLNPEDPRFIGRALTDTTPVIIHHFSSDLDLKFPLLSAGFLMSRGLVNALKNKLQHENCAMNNLEFSIDASYELALLISEVGIELTHSDQFCLQKNDHCITHVSLTNDFNKKFEVDVSEIFFAVKTCTKFHKNRLPIVAATWGKEAKRLNYYSDSYNKAIPTVVLNVVNTDHGHCVKTENIIADLRMILKVEKALKWVVISDDDTILSVSRIVELVRDYDSSTPIALGERYGYSLFQKASCCCGYNYLTGGAGVILSRAAVEKFKKNSCKCPSLTAPDDMFLFGVCFERLGIQLIHVPTMHQARPDDYSPDLLSVGNQTSFHKHWMIDPKHVYQKWFKPSSHDEL